MNEVQIQIFQGRGHLVQSQLWKNLVLGLRINNQSWMSQAEDGAKWNRIKMESKPDLNSWQRWFLCNRRRLWYWYIMKLRTFIFVYNCLLVVFVSVHESRDSQWGQRTTCEVWFSFHHVGPRDQTQVIRPGEKHPYSLCHLSPWNFLIGKYFNFS